MGPQTHTNTHTKQKHRMTNLENAKANRSRFAYALTIIQDNDTIILIFLEKMKNIRLWIWTNTAFVNHQPINLSRILQNISHRYNTTQNGYVSATVIICRSESSNESFEANGGSNRDFWKIQVWWYSNMKLLCSPIRTNSAHWQSCHGEKISLCRSTKSVFQFCQHTAAAAAA